MSPQCQWNSNHVAFEVNLSASEETTHLSQEQCTLRIGHDSRTIRFVARQTEQFESITGNPRSRDLCRKYCRGLVPEEILFLLVVTPALILVAHAGPTITVSSSNKTTGSFRVEERESYVGSPLKTWWSSQIHRTSFLLGFYSAIEGRDRCMGAADGEAREAPEEEEKPRIEPLRLPTPEEIRGQDIWNNCAVRSVVSGIMGENASLFLLKSR